MAICRSCNEEARVFVMLGGNFVCQACFHRAVEGTPTDLTPEEEAQLFNALWEMNEMSETDDE